MAQERHSLGNVGDLRFFRIPPPSGWSFFSLRQYQAKSVIRRQLIGVDFRVMAQLLHYAYIVPFAIPASPGPLGSTGRKRDRGLRFPERRQRGIHTMQGEAEVFRPASRPTGSGPSLSLRTLFVARRRRTVVRFAGTSSCWVNLRFDSWARIALQSGPSYFPNAEEFLIPSFVLRPNSLALSTMPFALGYRRGQRNPRQAQARNERRRRMRFLQKDYPANGFSPASKDPPCGFPKSGRTFDPLSSLLLDTSVSPRRMTIPRIVFAPQGQKCSPSTQD